MAAGYTAVEVTYIPKGGTAAAEAARIDAAVTALETVTVIQILEGQEGWYLVAGTSA